MKILVTGANGQLGRCIELIHQEYPECDFIFTDVNDLDIVKTHDINAFFDKHQFDYVVNCAAYTNVEQAEKESNKAFLVNAEGVKNLAEVCKKRDVTLIHISTDYVFDGQKRTPYIEKDSPNPINEYGNSKLKGEENIQEILEKYFIVRTSWLYSQFGKNFYKTILKKSEKEKELTITTSEIGTPTNGNDLAKFLLEIINSNSKNFGIYHFGNLGSTTWYGFTKEILRFLGKLDQIILEKTDNYPTFARRPAYSVLSKEKCIKNFDLEIFNWKESLKKLMIE